jgi:PAS domain S-box-containing protein
MRADNALRSTPLIRIGIPGAQTPGDCAPDVIMAEPIHEDALVAAVNSLCPDRACGLQAEERPREGADRDRPAYRFVVHDVTGNRPGEDALRECEVRVRRRLEAVLSREEDIATLELGEIIDAPAVQALMESFYKFAPMPMSIVDMKGKLFVGVGWQDACIKFHRANPESCRRCNESDTQLSGGVPAGEFRLYKCKNNMWHMATPIMVGGRQIGNILSGQFFFEDEPFHAETFRAQAARYGFKEREYLDAIGRVPRFSRAFLESGMIFVMQLGQMISAMSYSNIRLARSLAERDGLTASLRQASEQRRLALDASELGAWDYRFASGEVFWDERCRNLLGFTTGDHIEYVEAMAHIHPEDQAATDRAVKAALAGAGDGVYQGEFRVVWPDGSVHWVASHGRVYFEGSGARRLAKRFVGVNMDITPRKHAETERNRLSAAMEQAAEGVAIMDCGGTIVYVNPAFEKFTGYTFSEVLGKNYRTLESGSQDETLYRQMWATLAQGEVWRGRTRNLRKDGTTYHEDTTISPVRDESGRIINYLAVTLDISREVELEARRAHAEGALDAFFANSPTAMGIWGLDGTALRRNRALELLVESEGSHRIGGPIFQHVDPADLPAAREAFARLLASGQLRNFECRLIGSAGSARYALINAVTLPDQGVIYMTASDITERKKMEEELRQARLVAVKATEAKSSFLATMSHEIRTPMNGILPMAQLLMMAQLDDDARRQYARVILNSGQTLLTLLNDILDLSKIEAGRIDLRPSPFCPEQMLREIATLFTERAAEKRLLLDFE